MTICMQTRAPVMAMATVVNTRDLFIYQSECDARFKRSCVTPLNLTKNSSFGDGKPTQLRYGVRRGGFAKVRSTIRVKCAVQASETPTANQDPEALKAELMETLSTTDGNLTDESKALIESLEQVNPVTAPATHPDLYDGHFQLLNSSMQGVLYRGAIITLGRATFNAFQPSSLQIQMHEVYNDVGVRAPGAYDLAIEFTIVQEGSPPLEGLIVNNARCEREGSDRLTIVFLTSTLKPRNPERDLDAWLKIFKDANVGMDDQGSFQKSLPPAKGWLDITYLDKDMRITHGNHGSVVVVKKLGKAAIAF